MSVTDRLLGAPPVAAGGRWASRGRLRVLAMHGVHDVDAFDRQLDWLTARFVPVDQVRVLEWFRGGRELPDRALWMTFDDGDRTTLVYAAAALERHGVPATAFVCPALIEHGSAPWWEIVQRATEGSRTIRLGDREFSGAPAVTALKSVPDAIRRDLVEELALEVDPSASAPVTVDDLQRWRERGGEIGNHTWDHPCLDQCDAQEQVDQIDRAQRWLDEHALWDHRVFAYPNGDRTDHAEQHLDDAGYEVVALFDHHLVSAAPGPLRVSRLRLDAGAAAERTAAVTSGLHSGLFSLRSRIAARPSERG